MMLQFGLPDTSVYMSVIDMGNVAGLMSQFLCLLVIGSRIYAEYFALEATDQSFANALILFLATMGWSFSSFPHSLPRHDGLVFQ